MGYLTPHVLAVLDTRLYVAVRGGVNKAFSKGSGLNISSNQPQAIAAQDASLLERVKFHYRFEQHVSLILHAIHCTPDCVTPHRHREEFNKQFKKTAYLLYLPKSRT